MCQSQFPYLVLLSVSIRFDINKELGEKGGKGICPNIKSEQLKIIIWGAEGIDTIRGRHHRQRETTKGVQHPPSPGRVLNEPSCTCPRCLSESFWNINAQLIHWASDTYKLPSLFPGTCKASKRPSLSFDCRRRKRPQCKPNPVATAKKSIQ